MNTLVLILAILLAAANGANDVPKGVATLAAAGVMKLRTALAWGTATTAAGCLVSLHFAAKLTALFSKGIVTAKPTPAFAAAVLVGTLTWVALATWRSLPVSTTHALVGSLLGAGTVFAGSTVRWNVLLIKVVQPLLLSILLAWGLAAALGALSRWASRRATAARAAVAPQPTPQLVRIGGPSAASVAAVVQVTPRPWTEARTLNAMHWFTSGLTSFARGMNDAPKIVAIGSLALLAGMTPTMLLMAVTTAMAVGGILAGHRVGRCLATCVTTMSHMEGFTANLATATLVGLGAFKGLPMSTTHVSSGAISGTAGADLSRLDGSTVRQFAAAWFITLPFAATVAAAAYVALG